jgi:hypothetical protein
LMKRLAFVFVVAIGLVTIGFAQIPADAHLTQDELINACKVLTGLTNAAVTAQDTGKVILYSAAFKSIRPMISDPTKISSYVEYFEKLEKQNGARLSPAIISITDIPTLAPGWRHREIDELLKANKKVNDQRTTREP